MSNDQPGTSGLQDETPPLDQDQEMSEDIRHRVESEQSAALGPDPSEKGDIPTVEEKELLELEGNTQELTLGLVLYCGTNH